jgi:hypothetical protein
MVGLIGIIGMRVVSNNSALKHLLLSLDDGEREAQPCNMLNKTNYQIAQSILKRVKEQPCESFKVDLSNKEFRRLTKLLFDLYEEQLGEFSDIVQQIKTQEQKKIVRAAKSWLELISESINTILPDWQDPNREIIEGQFQLWKAGKVVPPQRYKCACCSEPIFYYDAEQYYEMQKIKKRLKELRTKEDRTAKERGEIARLEIRYNELKSKLNTMIEEIESGLGKELK